MKRALRVYFLEAIALLGLICVACVAAVILLTHERLTVPGWVPIIGQHFFEVEAELPSAQAVTPGQGQSVDIAGVNVGYIARVRVEQRHALVTLRLKPQFRHRVFKDASILLRPKTGLKDMVAELTPGSATAGELGSHARITIERTLPDVNFDEVLAALDSDTRSFLKLLLANVDQGLKGNSGRFAAALRRLDPVAAHTREAFELLAKRRDNLAHVVSSLTLLTDELARKDTQLARFVKHSNQVFALLAAQDANIRATLAELPTTLAATQGAMGKGGQLANKLGTTTAALRPGANALAQSLRDLRPFLHSSTPVIHNQLRPFARAAQPAVAELRPALRDMAASAKDGDGSLQTTNLLFNTLAYNPPGKQAGFLFWLAWANHLGASLFSTQDAHGATRRGLFLGNCNALQILQTIAASNPQLGTLVQLLNAPSPTEVCAPPMQHR